MAALWRSSSLWSARSCCTPLSWRPSFRTRGCLIQQGHCGTAQKHQPQSSTTLINLEMTLQLGVLCMAGLSGGSRHRCGTLLVSPSRTQSRLEVAACARGIHQANPSSASLSLRRLSFLYVFPSTHTRRTATNPLPPQTELDLLLLRLHELTSVVDTFFLLEATHSFTGIPRPLILHAALQNDSRFAPFRDQIMYRTHEGRSLRQGELPFAQEIEVRNAMDGMLKSALAELPTDEPTPVMLFSDVDELPRRSTASLLKACDFSDPEVEASSTIHLGMREFMYSYGWEVGGDTASWRASATVWQGRGEGEGEFYRHGKQTDRVLADSGWHCS